MSRRIDCSFDMDRGNRREIFWMLRLLTKEGRAAYMREVVRLLPPMARRKTVVRSDFAWEYPTEQMLDLVSLVREWGLSMDRAVRLLTSHVRRAGTCSGAATRSASAKPNPKATSSASPRTARTAGKAERSSGSPTGSCIIL